MHERVDCFYSYFVFKHGLFRGFAKVQLTKGNSKSGGNSRTLNMDLRCSYVSDYMPWYSGDVESITLWLYVP